MHKTKGNFNSQIGLPLTILEMKRNTEFLILEMGMSEKGCRIIERFTWNSFRGNCPKVDVKNQNLFKNACILQSEEIEYSVNIKSDDQEKYMMQRSTESNWLLERLRYRMMERHL
ncbi:UDP-N-acetylmuramoyl-tripeptide--D-alanyl-D- alanine ligase [Bacillus cereus BGSC 6E1]|nr:UDP-N-acetylmuramoyl-tripeptide--D-alanyl-D- alanine ligase [Bacillus cereus BGSC 6E1]